MGFVSDKKSIPKSISHFRRITRRLLGKTSRNSLITRTHSIGGILESKSWSLIMWYKHPLEIILQDFKQEIIRPLGKEFPPSTLKQAHLKIKTSPPLFYNQRRQSKHVANPYPILHQIKPFKFYLFNISNSIGQHYRTISLYPLCNHRLTHWVVTLKGLFRISGKM